MYCLLVEERFGKPILTGQLQYSDRFVDVPFNGDLRAKVLAALEPVRAANSVEDVHHWNYNRSDFGQQIVDPRNLVVIPGSTPAGPYVPLHRLIHELTQSAPNQSIQPQHVLNVPGYLQVLP